MLVFSKTLKHQLSKQRADVMVFIDKQALLWPLQRMQNLAFSTYVMYAKSSFTQGASSHRAVSHYRFNKAKPLSDIRGHSHCVCKMKHQKVGTDTKEGNPMKMLLLLEATTLNFFHLCILCIFQFLEFTMFFVFPKAVVHNPIVLHWLHEANSIHVRHKEISCHL